MSKFLQQQQPSKNTTLRFLEMAKYQAHLELKENGFDQPSPPEINLKQFGMKATHIQSK